MKNIPPLFFVCLLFLSGCTSQQFPSCKSQYVSHPDGSCHAYFYQTDYKKGGQITQVLVTCEKDRSGGNVVSINSIANGVGLRWVNKKHLEITLPSGAPVENKELTGQYGNITLQYSYRVAEPNEPAIKGCEPK